MTFLKNILFLIILSNSTILLAQDNSKNPGKTPVQQATEAAAREVGRVIGNKIGKDSMNQMTTDDKRAILERARAATRGEMIKKYNFEDSPYYNEVAGYISVLREGINRKGNRCLQYEIDLVYRVDRLFLQPVMCEISADQWSEFLLSEIIFPNRGPSDPFPGSSSPFPTPGDPGGWLPPL